LTKNGILSNIYGIVYSKEFLLKKIFVLGFLVVFMAVGMFADGLSLSAGGGTLLGYTFTRYSLESDTSSPGGKIRSDQNMDRLNYGGFLFFDAAYGELTIIVQGGYNSYQETMDTKSAGSSWDPIDTQSGIGTGTEMSLGFSLMGKYPFSLGDKFKVFPLLGMEYQIALIEHRKPDGGSAHDRSSGYLETDRDKNNNPYPLSAWNSLWIDFGVGIDYAFKERFFMRGEFIFGIRMQTAYEIGALEMMKNPPFNAKDPKLSGLTGSPTLKLAVGYKFWEKT
jgi:hypothetical protein